MPLPEFPGGHISGWSRLGFLVGSVPPALRRSCPALTIHFPRFMASTHGPTSYFLPTASLSLCKGEVLPPAPDAIYISRVHSHTSCGAPRPVHYYIPLTLLCGFASSVGQQNPSVALAFCYFKALRTTMDSYVEGAGVGDRLATFLTVPAAQCLSCSLFMPCLLTCS